jgi:hypothetical protein
MCDRRGSAFEFEKGGAIIYDLALLQGVEMDHH